MNLFLLPVALVVTLSGPVPAGDAHRELQVPMQPDPGYYAEQCLPLKAGETVRYRIVSPHPVDFNIHYRDRRDTLYPIRINHVTKHEGRLHTRVAGKHCFMWINNERQDDTYSIRLILEPNTAG